MSNRSYKSKVLDDTGKHIEGYKELIPKWILGIGIIIFLIYYRSPSLFFEPRFWAEEGQGYFAYAFSHSILGSLITPHYGYYGLIPNMGGIMATFVPLEYAPLVTTCLAALIQLIVSSYVIFCDSPYWNTFPKKLTVACFIQMLCPPECWVTTISSQYFLSIIAFFILIETDSSQKSWMKWPSRGLLSVSALTGPAVIFLLPVFIFKSYRTRSREDWLRVAIVFFGACVQAIAFIQTFLNASGQLGGRFDSSGFNLSNIVFIHFADSMLGTYYLYLFNYFGINFVAVEIALMGFEIYVFYLLVKSFFYKQLQLHAISFLLLTVPVILLSLRMCSSYRAAFAPSIIIISIMVYEAGNVRNRYFLRVLAVCVLSVVFMLGLLEHDMKVICNNVPVFWKDEVRLWRQDNNYKLRIWPQYEDTSWQMKLDSEK